MAHNADWIPTRTKDFKAFAGNFCPLVETNAAKWGVSDADKAETATLKTGFDAAQETAATPATRTSVTIAAAKAARAALEAHLRHLKRVAIDPGFESGTLTLSDYLALGLTPHDTTNTPVADPTSRPLLYDVKDLGGFAVRMHFKDEHIEHSQAVLPGCNGCLVNYQYGPEQVTDVTKLTLTQLFTASPSILQLPPDAEGAWLSIAPRWQLAKDGILGPWGTVEHVRVT
ncbi:MAG: hypothetical protein LBS64_06685 [Spirochaetaceae bacterium]|jgi:hypothetical protein|nr:hypothetical protein [Spirochaetaceae bacterium]